MQVATSIYIVLYFDQYRSVAIGIMFAIAALAGVVGPSLLMVLSSAYGLKGTFIVTGGLMLNVIPLTLMLRNPRPITWSVCRHFSKPNQPENGVIRLAHNTTVVTGSCNLGDTFCQSSEDVERRVDDNLGDKKVLTTRKAAPGYGAILPPVLPQSQSTSPEVSENNNTILLHIFSLLKKPSFYVLLTAGLAADFTLPVVNSTMADYGRDNGMPSEEAAQLLTVLHFGGMCGHVIIPLVGDKLKCARCTIAALTCALLAVCFFIMPQIHSAASLFAVAFVAGLQIGYILTIKPVLVADYLGVRSLALSWGLIGAISLPVAFGEPEIVGE
ncbi:uncharacterized protein LOC144144714 [Haemaphysalis longicornis]